MRSQDIKYGKVYHFEDSHFYAASGSIVFHDNRKDDHCSIKSIATFQERGEYIAQQLAKLGPQFAPRDIEHKQKLRRLLHDMDLCIKEAKAQGDPMDPAVQKWFRTHKPWKGRQALVGGVAATRRDPISYEIPMPPLPRALPPGPPKLILPGSNN